MRRHAGSAAGEIVRARCRGAPWRRGSPPRSRRGVQRARRGRTDGRRARARGTRGRSPRSCRESRRGAGRRRRPSRAAPTTSPQPSTPLPRTRTSTNSPSGRDRESQRKSARGRKADDDGLYAFDREQHYASSSMVSTRFACSSTARAANGGTRVVESAWCIDRRAGEARALVQRGSLVDRRRDEAGAGHEHRAGSWVPAPPPRTASATCCSSAGLSITTLDGQAHRDQLACVCGAREAVRALVQGVEVVEDRVGVARSTRSRSTGTLTS